MYTISQLTRIQKIKKLSRFYSIYGFSRTYIKLFGRLRYKAPIALPFTLFKPNKKNIAIIGCGQFSFATIGYFLRKNQGKAIYGVYDVDKKNSRSFTNYFGGEVFDSVDKLISKNEIKYVYIASNHYSHTEYAIKAIKQNKYVYIEKPISVNRTQFNDLLKYYKEGRVFSGYNRPFSPAIKKISSLLTTTERSPLTLSCFISAHKIPPDNWYRNPEEGTRICGNIGHWLDLAIHLLNKISLPNTLKVNINSTSVLEVDDNLSITLISDKEDLINIIMTSRTEPFEGIDETINFQHGNLIAKIDDFRKMTVWQDDKIIKKIYKRKDVGHQSAILQPFNKEDARNFQEIKISTRLMLDIKESVLKGVKEFTFNINETNNPKS